jgi:hypothetical protein
MPQSARMDFLARRLANHLVTLVDDIKDFLGHIPENLFSSARGVERGTKHIKPRMQPAAVTFSCVNSRDRIHLPEPEGGLIFIQLMMLTMSNAGKEPSPASDLLKNSTLYREFQAEREEILKHKWIESEKAGHDIGFERALTDWIIKHRTQWRKARQTATQN